VKANAADYVSRLQARIKEIQALADKADTAEKPEELEKELRDTWNSYV
jgi:hypothetical protein